MASLSKDGAGWRILFVCPESQKRKTIHLGKVPRRAAESIKGRVEALVSCKASKYAPDADLAGWLRTIPDALADKLAAVGLVEKRGRATLAGFLDEYIASRHDVKPGTIMNLTITRNALVQHLGPDKLIRDITPGDADGYRLALLETKLAENTVRRRCGRAKQFFHAAVRQQLIASNPFADLKSAIQANTKRFHFVTRDEIEKVIGACPDAQWRLIVALGRYGGLRCPSETLSLRWGDVDWERGRIRVPSPKTEHHTGGESRIIPLFPELRPYLEEVFDQAAPGTEHVITRYRDTRQNLRSRLLDIIWAAGVKEWPKLFQTMRSTRETELAEEFPMHVVCKWIGNSQPVADKHYLQLTDAHFEKALRGDGGAAQNPAQYAPKPGSKGGYKKQQAPVFPEENEGLPLCTAVATTPQGLEP